MAQPITTGDLSYHLRSRQDERRSQPRLRCKGTAELRLLSSNNRISGALLSGAILDLSVSGCCVETAAAIPPIENPVVEAILTVNKFTLRVAGVVRHVKEDRRAGIEFVDVTKRKAEQIEELVKELIERENECQALAEQRAEEGAA